MSLSPATKLLRDLVALPSVNPAFTTAGDPFSGEKRVAHYLSATAARAGLDIEFQEVFPQRSNLLARLTPRGPVKQRVLLAPHMDTVGGDKRLFNPMIKNGRLHGRGACDTKGSVAAMLTALCRIASGRKRPAQTEIVFAGLVDEENGQCGSRALVCRGFRADLAIVGEPTRLKVITAHKGDLWLRLETTGKAAHGARPELGINAVHKMAKVVDALETAYATQLRRKRHPLLGRPTVNVGSIRGGTQANIVPDKCSILIDRRTLPGETEATVRKDLASLFRRHKIQATVFDTKGALCLALETDPRLPLARQFMQSVGQKKPLGVDFFCDASVLAHGGTPSVVFGPGDIAQAHTVDEWVSLSSLERATDMLTRFLQSLP